ncbi:MAG: hypothetical protein QM731_19195 [Chitinophagaceae bacterium]
MELGYKKLLSVVIQHNYYRTNSYNKMVLVALSETAGIIWQFDLLLKQQGNRYHILYDTNKTDNIQFLLNSNTTLTFLLYPGDPLFANYTNIPITNGGGTVIPFTSNSGDETLSLGKAIPVENIASKEEWQSLQKKYRLQPVAVIQINTSHITPPDPYSPPQQGPEFILQFDARTVIWKYIIATKAKKLPDSLRIVNKAQKTAEVFHEPSSMQLPNGDIACLFESTKEIPVTDYGAVIFQLINNVANNTDVILDTLPNAQIQLLLIGKENKWVSETYLYI